MKTLKHILAVILVLAAVLSLTACGDAGNNEATNPTTTAPAQTQPVSQPSTEPSVDDGKVTYTVTVLDAQGNPMSGVFVQMCLESCFPGATDANGVATFTMIEADYKVSFVVVPNGFAAEDAYYFAPGEYSMTIQLKAA